MPPSKHKKKQRTEIIKDSAIKLSFRGKKILFFFLLWSKRGQGPKRIHVYYKCEVQKWKFQLKEVFWFNPFAWPENRKSARLELSGVRYSRTLEYYISSSSEWFGSEYFFSIRVGQAPGHSVGHSGGAHSNLDHIEIFTVRLNFSHLVKIGEDRIDGIPTSPSFQLRLPLVTYPAATKT